MSGSRPSDDENRFTLRADFDERLKSEPEAPHGGRAESKACRYSWAATAAAAAAAAAGRARSTAPVLAVLHATGVHDVMHVVVDFAGSPRRLRGPGRLVLAPNATRAVGQLIDWRKVQRCDALRRQSLKECAQSQTVTVLSIIL
jgi:hypothetical protein